jgi:hypothetical protein
MVNFAPLEGRLSDRWGKTATLLFPFQGKWVAGADAEAFDEQGS